MKRKGMGAGKGKGYKNIQGRDPKVHSDSSKGRKQPQKIKHFMLSDKPLSQPKAKELSQRQISNRKYEEFIIDSIDSSGYDENPKTDKEKLQFLKDTFKSEYGHMIDRVGEQRAFAEWLSGLPSSVNFPHMNSDILDLAKRMGSLPEDATEKQEDRVLENYWNFMSVKTFQAFKKHKIK